MLAIVMSLNVLSHFFIKRKKVFRKPFSLSQFCYLLGKMSENLCQRRNLPIRHELEPPYATATACSEFSLKNFPLLGENGAHGTNFSIGKLSARKNSEVKIFYLFPCRRTHISDEWQLNDAASSQRCGLFRELLCAPQIGRRRRQLVLCAGASNSLIA